MENVELKSVSISNSSKFPPPPFADWEKVDSPIAATNASTLSSSSGTPLLLRPPIQSSTPQQKSSQLPPLAPTNSGQKSTGGSAVAQFKKMVEDLKKDNATKSVKITELETELKVKELELKREKLKISELERGRESIADANNQVVRTL